MTLSRLSRVTLICFSLFACGSAPTPVPSTGTNVTFHPTNGADVLFTNRLSCAVLPVAGDYAADDNVELGKPDLEIGIGDVKSLPATVTTFRVENSDFPAGKPAAVVAFAETIYVPAGEVETTFYADSGRLKISSSGTKLTFDIDVHVIEPDGEEGTLVGTVSCTPQPPTIYTGAVFAPNLTP